MSELFKQSTRATGNEPRISPVSSGNNRPAGPMFPDHGVWVPVGFFLLLIAMFAVQRLVILIAGIHLFDSLSGLRVIKSFLVGLRFDTVVACTLIFPLLPMLLITPPTPPHGWGRGLITRYCAVVLGLVFFLCIMDFFFFMQFGERLNYKAIEYLKYDYVHEIMWKEYPMMVLLVVMAVLITISAKPMDRLFFAENRWLLSADRRRNPVLLSLCRIIWPFLLPVLLVVGTRGGIGPKPINAGPAYFANSDRLAQLTLNGIFTLREALFDVTSPRASLADYFELLSEKEATDLTRQMLVRPQDELLDSRHNPLHRITDTGRPRKDYNVVLVIMESLSWHYIGAMGGPENLTPNLDALISQGLFFDQCYAVGARTTRGLCGIVCGFPDLPGKSVTTRSRSEGTFLTLATVLAGRGYETMFIYGGQPMYDHRQSFLGSNGCHTFVFPDRFERKTFKTHLGYCDGDLFDQANREFLKMGREPFFAILLTLTFHREFQCPVDNLPPSDPLELRHQQKQSIRYSDWAIGEFIRKAKQEPYFDRTIFVFVADHPGGYRKTKSTPAAYRVPLLIYAPKILKPARCRELCSQTDVPATIMSLLGGSYEHCFFGSSVLDRPPDAGLALLQYSDQFVLIGADRRGVIIQPGRHTTLFRLNGNDGHEIIDPLDDLMCSERDQLQRRAAALLQTAHTVVKHNNYNLPAQTALKPVRNAAED